jgi:hypothetical protein
MIQNSVPIEDNKKICEAFGCLAVATTEITLEIGQQRAVSLHLCKNCVVRFQEV